MTRPDAAFTVAAPTPARAPRSCRSAIRPSRVASAACTAFVVAALAACASDQVAEPAVLVRDSAGIRIVEAQQTSWTAASWTIASEPDWLVGEMEGDPNYLLSRVEGALALDGGLTVVANGATNDLRFFDDQGEWVKTLGGEGGGPGEFDYLRALGRCRSDGFTAFDINWQQNSYLEDGTFVDKTMFLAPSGISPYALACDGAGNVLLLGWGRLEGPPEIGLHETRDRLVSVGAQGEVRADFGERLVSERIGTRGGSSPHPAGRATRFALHDGRAYIGSGERFEVEVWDLDGTLRELIRGPRVPLDMDDAMRESLREDYLERRLSTVDDASRRASIRTAVADMEWPNAVPAFTDVRVDELGVIWLRRFSIDTEAPEAWSLLDPDQGYLGDLGLAPRQTLLTVGADHLLVLVRDELDVERVARLRLHRGAGD